MPDEHQRSRALAWQTKRMMRIADRVEAGDTSHVSQADIDRIFRDALRLAREREDRVR